MGALHCIVMIRGEWQAFYHIKHYCMEGVRIIPHFWQLRACTAGVGWFHPLAGGTPCHKLLDVGLHAGSIEVSAGSFICTMGAEVGAIVHQVEHVLTESVVQGGLENCWSCIVSQW